MDQAVQFDQRNASVGVPDDVEIWYAATELDGQCQKRRQDGIASVNACC